jgi:hypothetical protein
MGTVRIPCKAAFARFAKPIRRTGFTGASEFTLSGKA